MLCARCLAMSFHLSKARPDGQFMNANRPPQGAHSKRPSRNNARPRRRHLPQNPSSQPIPIKECEKYGIGPIKRMTKICEGVQEVKRFSEKGVGGGSGWPRTVSILPGLRRVRRALRLKAAFNPGGSALGPQSQTI